MEKFIIYTDGSSRGNPGPGGWAAIVIKALRQAQGDNGRTVIEIGGREEKTTNNRMEMMAAIHGLKSVLEGVGVEIHTDSEYLLKGATKWILGWQKNNWRTKDKRAVLNQDLWEKLIAEMEKRNVGWRQVAGHSSHKLNDRADKIATQFADGKAVKLYNGPYDKYFFK
ncbi:MAG: ribonuclease HI [Patescibacteria group bacterium]